MMPRFKISELSTDRVISAIRRRMVEVPHTIAWTISNAGKRNRERIYKMKDRHAGERCFLIANGPSLKKTDLSLLKNEFTIGMNRIYLMFDEMDFVPDYFVCVEELVLEQFHKEIDALPMPKFLNWRCREHFDNANTCYLKENYDYNYTFQKDAFESMNFGGTVTFAALQVAYFLGFTEVIIVGMDHNFVEKGTPATAEVRNQEEDESHFHPQYFPKGVKWKLPDLLKSELSYSKARDYYTQNKRRIYDATIGGKCDVFEKRPYPEIVYDTKTKDKV